MYSRHGLHACFQHVALDVIESAVNFFPGIENVLRVENLFRLFKEGDHLRSEEEREVGRADDAVVVLAGRRAAFFDNELIDAGREVEDNLAVFFF